MNTPHRPHFAPLLPQLHGFPISVKRGLCLTFMAVMLSSLLLAFPRTASAHRLGGCPPSEGIAATSWGAGRLDVFTTQCSTPLNTHYWQGPGEAGFKLEPADFTRRGGLLSAVSSKPGRLDVFSVEISSLQHFWQDGGSSFQQEPLPPYPSPYAGSNPVAISWGSGRLDVFVIGGDGQLYHFWQGPGEAGLRMESLGGSLSTTSQQSLAAVTWGSGRLDAFVIGTDGQLYHFWQGPGEAVFHHEPLGAMSSVDTLHAVSWGPERLDLFAIASGQLVHYWQESGMPFQEENLGGSFNSENVTAVTWGTGRLDAFALGTDQQLYHFWKGPADAVFQEENLGGSWFTGYGWGNLTAVSWGAPRLDVFVVDQQQSNSANGRYHHFWEDAGDWGFHQEVMEAL